MLFDITNLILLLPVLTVKLYPFNFIELLLPVVHAIDSQRVTVRIRSRRVERADATDTAEHMICYFSVEFVGFQKIWLRKLYSNFILFYHEMVVLFHLTNRAIALVHTNLRCATCLVCDGFAMTASCNRN